MSYSVDVDVEGFQIKAANLKLAMQALGNADQNKLKTKWSNGPLLANYGRLDEWLEACGWSIVLDADFNLIKLYREQESLAENEDFMFGVLAPFIEPGARIEFRGEDGERWRYVFDGERMQGFTARIEWEPD